MCGDGSGGGEQTRMLCCAVLRTVRWLSGAVRLGRRMDGLRKARAAMTLYCLTEVLVLAGRAVLHVDRLGLGQKQSGLNECSAVVDGGGGWGWGCVEAARCAATRGLGRTRTNPRLSRQQSGRFGHELCTSPSWSGLAGRHLPHPLRSSSSSRVLIYIIVYCMP